MWSITQKSLSIQRSFTLPPNHKCSNKKEIYNTNDFKHKMTFNHKAFYTLEIELFMQIKSTHKVFIQ